jgi:hypothetical protein
MVLIVALFFEGFWDWFWFCWVLILDFPRNSGFGFCRFVPLFVPRRVRLEFYGLKLGGFGMGRKLLKNEG